MSQLEAFYSLVLVVFLTIIVTLAVVRLANKNFFDSWICRDDDIEECPYCGSELDGDDDSDD